MKFNDPIKLQRLIDGECNEAEVRSLLMDADNHPQRWRAIATAFVEDQIWRKQFGAAPENESDLDSGSLAATCTWKPQPGITDNGNTSASGLTIVEESVIEKQPDSKFTVDHNPPIQNWVKWFSMAAAIMLATAVGFWLGQDRISAPTNFSTELANQSVETPRPLDRELVDPISTDKHQLTPVSLQPDYHLKLVDADGQPTHAELTGGVTANEIPLYAVNSADQWERFNRPTTKPVSPELVQQLTSNGFQMQEDVNFISGSLRDGRSFVVPVRTVSFLPGQ